MLDEDLQVQKVKENSRGSDEDMRQVGGVDFSKISGVEPKLFFFFRS